MQLKGQASFYRAGVILSALAGMGLRAATSPWLIYHPDSGLYMQLARRLASGSLYIPIGGEKGLYQPLFSATTMLLGVITRNLETAGCLVSIIASGAVIVIAGSIGRRTYGDKVGVISAAIAALHPGMVHFGAVALTESLYTAFFTGAVLLGIMALQADKSRQWFISGVVMGLSYLTRVVGLFELPVLAFWAYRSRKGRKGAARPALLAVVGCMILAGPYLLYLRSNLGNWYLTGQQRLSYYKTMARNDRAEVHGVLNPYGDRFAARVKADRLKGFSVVFSRLDYLATRSAGNLKAFYTQDIPILFAPLFMLLIAVGIISLFKAPPDERRSMFYLISWWVTAIPLQMVTSTNYRYYVAFVPLMAILAGRGITFLGDNFNEGRKGKAVTVVTAALLVTFIATIRYGADPDARWVEPQRRAASWIKENHHGKVTVLTREPYVAFYAGGDQVSVPGESLPIVLQYARRYGVNFIVVDNLLVANFHPQLAPLLNPANAPKPWKLVHSEREGERVIYVYKSEEF